MDKNNKKETEIKISGSSKIGLFFQLIISLIFFVILGVIGGTFHFIHSMKDVIKEFINAILLIINGISEKLSEGFLKAAKGFGDNVIMILSSRQRVLTEKVKAAEEIDKNKITCEKEYQIEKTGMQLENKKQLLIENKEKQGNS